MIQLKLNELPFIEEITNHLGQGPIGLVYLDIVNFGRMEKRHGRVFCENLLLTMSSILREMKQDIPSLITHYMMGDDFFIYLQFRERSTAEDHRKAVEEYRKLLKAYMEKKLGESFGLDESIELHSGSSLLFPSSDKDMSSLIYQSMKAAIRDAKEHNQLDLNQLQTKEFQRILTEQLIRSVYQPIVCLNTGTIFGHEALTRGPEESMFHSPVALFDFAKRDGNLYMMDTLAREKAIQGSLGMHKNQKLFINIPSDIMNHPEFTPGRTMKVLHSVGLQPRNIVLEITERSSIEDFTTVKKVLQHYRSQGYQIAIDDAGAGYSSLQAIAEIQPDYIKVDRSLIHGIHKDRIKEWILETFVTFAGKMNIRIIAEGIEEREDLEKVLRMGVHYAQGYLLRRPGGELAERLDPSLAEFIHRRREQSQLLAKGAMIGEIAVDSVNFDYSVHCSEVAKYFREHEEDQGVVILKDNRPVGLMMREKLFQQLAGHYGISLYWSKAIEQLMDPDPLIVEASLSLKDVSRLAMARDRNKLYDLVIVTSGGRFSGVTSIQSLLEQLTLQQMEFARVANPLTGLPGNLQIQQAVASRLEQCSRFSVIYADLDYFKWFNDCYGFQKGDELIQYTAGILQQGVLNGGETSDFVGHIGGDDFIVLTSAADPEALCQSLIEAFDQQVASFYGGQVEYVEDRKGNVIDTMGVTLSLSLVICESCEGTCSDDISRAAAALKKKAKSHRGSVYMTERLSGVLK